MSTEEHNLVLILARGLASSVATPMLLVGVDGSLLYYNESAEEILGRRYAETGELPPEWRQDVEPRDTASGELLDFQELPLTIALNQRTAAHRPLTITGFDGSPKAIQVTAFPLFARTDEFVGAVAIFWEEEGT